MLRGNWSSTMVSASAPSSVASQDDSSPAAACCQRPRKRRQTSTSNISSCRYQLSCPASRQKFKTSTGAMLRASDMVGRSRHRCSGRGLLFVAQLAAQDLADIGLGQVGPELDLLGDL